MARSWSFAISFRRASEATMVEGGEVQRGQEQVKPHFLRRWARSKEVLPRVRSKEGRG